MQPQNLPISSLVDMDQRGELRWPEIQRHYVGRTACLHHAFRRKL